MIPLITYGATVDGNTPLNENRAKLLNKKSGSVHFVKPLYLEIQIIVPDKNI
jgi:hypothetical protein